MQRRIEQAHGDGKPRHDGEKLGEVRALERQELGQRPAASSLVFGKDHLAHRDDAVFVEEHVLGAAQPDALRPELARRARVGRRFGIGAHRHAADAVRPSHKRGKLARKLGLQHGDGTHHHLAVAAVDGDHIALV